MPLSMLSEGETNHIKRIGGKDDVRRFLVSLGFTVGGEVTLLSKKNGSVIVKIKQTRVAVSREMASKIFV